MLNRGASRFRDWAVFALVALLPAIAMGVLGFWALRNEEAARLREMRLQVRREADDRKTAFDAQVAALQRDAESTAVFADPVSMSAAELSHDGERDAAGEQRCLEWAGALRRGEATAREKILASCSTTRTTSGRMLWPLVALPKGGASAEALLGWLRAHAHELGPAERAATRDEIGGAARFSDEQRAALSDALSQAKGGALRALLSDRRSMMLAGRAAIVWAERSSLGELRRTPKGGYRGYVVHAGSLARALRSGWPEGLPEGMSARLVPDPEAAARLGQSVAHAVELLPGGTQLVVAYDDPGAIARRSKLVLISVAALAALAAMALAALLFARMRRERHLSALRTDFVAAVSHELRTPIASIRMLSELLADGLADEAEHQEMHRALAREAKRLGATVNRLLGFSRMEAGKQKARLAATPLAEVVSSVVDTFEQRHDAVVVERELDATLSAAIDADALAMALDNLLENALKYALDGQPYRVTLTASGDEARIAVADRGPGIARRDQKRIFRPFERADDRLSEATEGSGIGLSLVRHVARVHGGRAILESNPGEGACFIICIPKEDSL